MSTIPTSVTEAQFEQHIRPYLKTAQRGYECKIPLCQYPETPAHRLSVVRVVNYHRSEQPRKKEISWQAVYYHWQKWNAADCFEQIWQHSLALMRSPKRG